MASKLQVLQRNLAEWYRLLVPQYYRFLFYFGMPSIFIYGKKIKIMFKAYI